MDEENLNAALMNRMFADAAFFGSLNKKPITDYKDDLDEEEAMEIIEEFIDVLKRHKLSYKNSYRVMLSLTASFAMGGIELFGNGFPQ